MIPSKRPTSHKSFKRLIAILILFIAAGLNQFSFGQAAPAQQKKTDYSPYLNQHFPNRVYWGVAHVHTGYSFESVQVGRYIDFPALYNWQYSDVLDDSAHCSILIFQER
jgi:hypothetical protein